MPSKRLAAGKRNNPMILRSPNVFAALTMAIVIAFVGLGGRSHGQNQAAAEEQPREKPAGKAKPKVRGVPDYTKLTGVVEDAALPIDEPEILWKAGSWESTSSLSRTD